MMRVVVFLLLLAILPAQADNALSCPPTAKIPTPELIQDASSRAQDHGFMWRISKDGHASYLYGTLHVAMFDWMFPGPRVSKALSEIDTVALELDIVDADIRKRMERAFAAMPVTAVPKEMADRIQRQADAQCVPYQRLAVQAPELQVITLTMLEGRRDGLDASYAIDAVLAGFGHGARKEVVSLETPESQMQTLQMGSRDELLAFVDDALREMEAGTSRTLLLRLANDWAESNFSDLEHYEEWCECMKTPGEKALMKRMLEGRNPAMAERIDRMHHAGKRVFAAVGSLHMSSAIGLPSLMAKRGYKVERIDFKQPQ